MAVQIPETEQKNTNSKQASATDTIRVSVRTLVEFILRNGDIDSRAGRFETDSMQEGSRLHRKIQKSMDSAYRSEVPLCTAKLLDTEDDSFTLIVEGRADGIVTREDGTFLIDEIKCTYGDIHKINEPIPVHLAQARCYAYMLAEREDLLSQEEKTFGIQLTYCNIESEEVKHLTEELSIAKIREFFENLVLQYKKWAVMERKWALLRNESVKQLAFPYPYREGQKGFVTSVYRTILREKTLFAMAPTGVGKTLSVVFPAVKAMGEGLAEKIFYLTAKTILRTVAEESFAILSEHGLKMKTVTITAKEKVCVLEKPECNPFACPRAKGHFDRVNDALYDMLTGCESMTREVILSYAEKYEVCPFEFCLDLTLWADAVICDYNYVFDPQASLKRFFAGEQKQNYLFLVDEAHNLPERAREMYSATIVKEDFLRCKKLLQKSEPALAKKLEACNREMLELKHRCENFTQEEEFSHLVLCLERFLSVAEDYLKAENNNPTEREALLELYFQARSFCDMYEFAGEDYRFYTTYREDGSFYARVQCMQPSRALNECLKKGKSAVFFSATLLPVNYYRNEITGNEEDYAIYIPSPFPAKNRKVFIGDDVIFRYSDRTREMYGKAAEYLFSFAGAKTGNYLFFFSSYKMLGEIWTAFSEKCGENGEITAVCQKNNMTEAEKEEFLNRFKDNPTHTTVGFCVLGGIFGEGIDLKGERLIGAAIVGTGLPLVCEERELFKRYYEDTCENGFESAYLYPGMNKVLQAAGRVIRTANDRGVVLLLDSRFTKSGYRALFPREWSDVEKVKLNDVSQKLSDFWKNPDNKEDSH